jgi:nitroreductase
MTAIPASRESAWLDALLSRHSRRTFDGAPLPAHQLDELDSVAHSFRPYPDARVELIRDRVDDAFIGIAGSYGRIVGAPHLMAVIVDSSGPHRHQHAGYTGEALVLEASSQGFDTCWVGGLFRRDAVSRSLLLSPSEVVVAISPVGHAVNTRSGTERAMHAMAGSGSRKPLRKLARHAGPDWPAWALAAVEAARLAPSAMNRQPWRFRLEDGSLVISRDSESELPKVAKALDCGIAMLHIELAARANGTPGTWHDLSGERDLARYVPDLVKAPPSECA